MYDHFFRSNIHCYEKFNDLKIYDRGPFWIIENFIKAEPKKPYKCDEAVTYTTNLNFLFMDNIEPLVTRWQAPVSAAIYSPGTDYKSALDSVMYVRNCLNNSQLIREFVTFHFFYDQVYTPKNLVRDPHAIESQYVCPVTAPYVNVSAKETFQWQNNISYPLNVGRNVARETALTHFVFVSDVELYPSPGLVPLFLDMYSRHEEPKYNEVFVLPIFEVTKESRLPDTKAELVEMLKNKTAVLFHARICTTCHAVPKNEEWAQESTPTGKPRKN